MLAIVLYGVVPLAVPAMSTMNQHLTRRSQPKTEDGGGAGAREGGAGAAEGGGQAAEGPGTGGAEAAEGGGGVCMYVCMCVCVCVEVLGGLFHSG
jgi:hypothetical protein